MWTHHRAPFYASISINDHGLSDWVPRPDVVRTSQEGFCRFNPHLCVMSAGYFTRWSIERCGMSTWIRMASGTLTVGMVNTAPLDYEDVVTFDWTNADFEQGCTWLRQHHAHPEVQFFNLSGSCVFIIPNRFVVHFSCSAHCAYYRGNFMGVLDIESVSSACTIIQAVGNPLNITMKFAQKQYGGAARMLMAILRYCVDNRVLLPLWWSRQYYRLPLTFAENTSLGTLYHQYRGLPWVASSTRH